MEELRELEDKIEVDDERLKKIAEGNDALTRGSNLQSLWRGDDYETDESLRRTIAARLGLAGSMVEQSFETMSGGQRMRAALVLLSTLVHKPDLIVLDEPSNHFDLDTLACLTETLLQLSCSLLIVSHEDQFPADLSLDHRIDLDALKDD